MFEQIVNGVFARKTLILTVFGPLGSLDRKATLIYNKRINIRAFADRSGLLAMALFLTVDIFYERIIGVKI
jgi:hypothetical protein